LLPPRPRRAAVGPKPPAPSPGARPPPPRAAWVGVDKPLLVQYVTWIGGFVHADLGTSLSFHVPVAELLGRGLVNSLKLALVAFVMVVPLGILGGIVAALRRGGLADRLITIVGLSATVVPEFVSSIVLILVFSVT